MTAPIKPPWTQGRPPAVVEAIRVAAILHSVNPAMLLGKSREQPIVAARRSAMRDLRARGYSLPLIGKMLGGLHHTTVLYHCALKPVAPVAQYDPNAPDESGIWAI